jgi:hypothetical protein
MFRGKPSAVRTQAAGRRVGQIERDAGDWIVRCRICGAKNLVMILVAEAPVVTFEISGWRD